MQFTANFEQVPEGYIAFVEEIPGANILSYRHPDRRKNNPEVGMVTPAAADEAPIIDVLEVK